MAALPVRQMVLYKHGVGFFVREGAVSGTELAVTFRRDEINDILKSLVVFDKAGGQVLGIHYQTPMDKAARLENSSIRLSDKSSLRDLIKQLRGRRVELTIEPTTGTLEVVVGRVIGIDEPDGSALIGNARIAMPTHTIYVHALLDDGRTRIFPLDVLRGVKISDPLAGDDLSYFLDTSVAEDARRTVNIRLSEGDHQIAVYYVAPSPTWRVSYRIVAEAAEDKQTGKALLQSWGLFDNRLEEDLSDVQVTLVAGQPISFIYDLYASRIPERPVVQDESRVAPGPIEFASTNTRPVDDAVRFAPAPAMAMAAPAPKAAGGGLMRRLDARERAITLDDVAAAVVTNTETRDAGEFFQYEIQTPVSVMRGESALVPIISVNVEYNRELLYNGDKFPKNPVASLRFRNTTGLTLERGPVTVVEDGDYKGEAVIAFTKDGRSVYLPYAIELGVQVREDLTQTTEVARLALKDAYILHEEYRVKTVVYHILNTSSQDKIITVEAPKQTSWEPFDTAAADAETLNERRWRVTVPARQTTVFTRKERMLTHWQEDVMSLDYQNLQRFFENRWLDQAAYDRLSELLDTRAAISRAHDEQNKLNDERARIYEQQNQLRANLTTLQATGKEAALRDRMLDQLTQTQDRLEQIEVRLGALTQEIAESEAKLKQIVAGLGAKA
ncbi:MAG: hypothetical protein KF716_13080 [Anaerolineae bacterium]|nr:hypothetical protein [Anaerolineae bacterium]